MKSYSMKRTIFLLATAAFLLAGCKAAVDRREEEALRNQCHVPGYAALKEFKRLSGVQDGAAARYRVMPKDVAKFEAFMKNDGWQELAKPGSIQPRIPDSSAVSPAPERHGFIRYEKTGTPDLHKIVLSVYNEESHELLAVVRPPA